MKEDRRRRLEKYFLNADPFLWGIWKTDERMNKRDVYCWFRTEARRAWPMFDSLKVSDRTLYDDLARLLLSSPGIERVVKDLIIPTVLKLPVGAIIDDLRFLWMAGRYPDSEFLRKERGLKDGDGWPFLLEVGYTDTKYVAGWTQFAGVWFEEIEHIDD
ncbi:MAG: hypothetical protein ACTSYX_02105 [Candidatus Thorarchaeota archaeon]